MRAIILAGGRGRRLLPLTLHTSKSLLPIAGKPALAYTLHALPPDITSIIIAVKHFGEKIKHRFGKKFGKLPIRYVDLVSLRGTMDALKQCKRYVKGQTLVLYGDDVYSQEDLVNLVTRAKEDKISWYILVGKRDSSEGFGKALIEKERVKAIQESGEQEESAGDYGINTGAYVLDERIFRYKPVKTRKGEYGLPQTMMAGAKDIPLTAVFAKDWIPLNTAKDYASAQEILAKSLSRNSFRKESE